MKRNRESKWKKYIAKTGHKWYPIESITEYLMNCFGEVFGLEMSKSKLYIINGQLRFLSEYFLDDEREELIHGAEIFGGYLGDMDFVEVVEEKKMSRDLFTMQFVSNSVKVGFGEDEGSKIMHELVKLMLFDALIGNNDRHFYNWGVIRSLTESGIVRFSPVYDTARGLFWNVSEKELEKRILTNDSDKYISRYCANSRPKLGWEGISNINHFDMVGKIYENEFYATKDEIIRLYDESVLIQMEDLVTNEFRRCISKNRQEMIKKCLEYRYNTIKEIIK